MPRVVRAIGWTAGAIAGLGLTALAAVFAISEWKLRRTHDAPLVPQSFGAVTAPADLEEGRRLAIIVGCWAGCHGMQGEGDTLDAPIYRIATPALSDVLPAYGDAELVRLIRYGVKRDGRSTIAMPAATFNPLSNADLARIIAHLRRQPATAPVRRERHVTLLGRALMAAGAWPTSAEEVDRARPRWGELPRTTPEEHGRYLASITCSECHGVALRGKKLEGSPSIPAVIRAYSLESFRHLLRTGQPLSGRDLGIMSWTARNAFRYFTDDEIARLYAYLRSLPAG